MKIVQLCFFSLFAAVSICGERILVLTPIGQKSHKMALMPIAEGLAEKGHQVTVVSAYKADKVVENLKEIVIGNAEHKVPVDWFNFMTLSDDEVFRAVIKMHTQLNIFGYDYLMASREFRNIIQSKNVDLVIVDAILNDCTLPIIDSLNVPFIYHSSASIISFTMAAMGVPMDYASLPAGMPGYTDQMTFIQRLLNMVSSEIYLTVRKNSILRAVDEHVRQDYPDARPISVIERDAALCIANHHPATAWARPFPPNVLPIGALHVRPAQPLSKDLQLFADGANQGFIIFTLGSFIPMTSMPKHALDAFLRVFAKITQRVIWKWDGQKLENASNNILFIDWLPQQDLFAHPNARLFISHGGLLGIQEAVYHGVPLLGLPMMNDQPNNLAKIQREGMALALLWPDLSEHALYESINKILSDPSFTSNAKRLSNIMKDEMFPGKDAAVYWVEHVLRHGAKHLEVSSRKMPFYQQYLLDVWLFLAAILVIMAYLALSFLRCIFKCVKKPSKQNTQ